LNINYSTESIKYKEHTIKFLICKNLIKRILRNWIRLIKYKTGISFVKNALLEEYTRYWRYNTWIYKFRVRLL